ncbi:unnamed protein product [Allacma fusca]|uniref:Dr1-associated corepressor n=1 Tax=Allacma fusca TaxID=39272 RepID=A0A8J2MD63_9HEXA|nr:unnamed protein product [Allacma fusca]
MPVDRESEGHQGHTRAGVIRIAMPSKKKKYNARFPPARIKKIMQSDEDVGKVAQAVPVIISRALELFVESLLKKAEVVTQARNAKTLTPSHLKQCIMSEQRFDFLRDLVSSISDVQGEEDGQDPITPRPTPTIEHPFVFQSQTQGPSTSTSGPSDQQQQPQQQQQQHPTEMPEYMMSLPNQLQQHYIKQDEITTKSEQLYLPMSSPAQPSAMTSGHHHYPLMSSQPAMLNATPNNIPYIPGPSTNHPHHEHPQPPTQSQHFYYSQYDNSNGNVKIEAVSTNDARLYPEHVGEHSGFVQPVCYC